MGAIILQGPHHSAQKSTKTGLSDLSTSASKDENVFDIFAHGFLKKRDKESCCAFRIIASCLSLD
jgi:hypothetical protein